MDTWETGTEAAPPHRTAHAVCGLAATRDGVLVAALETLMLVPAGQGSLTPPS